MKKLLLLIGLFVSINLSAQIHEYQSFGIGFVKINEDCYQFNMDGITLFYNYKYLHLSASSNFAKGDGVYLGKLPKKSYLSNKKKFSAVDIGINIIPFKPNDGCQYVFTPTIGIVTIQDIINIDNSYYNGDMRDYFNFGLNVGIIDVKNHVEFIFGTGTKEIFSFSVGYYL